MSSNHYLENAMENGIRKDRMVEIANRAGVLEAKLEGLFRQSYQACTQRQFAGNLPQYSLMFKEIGEMVTELEDLVQEHLYLKKQEEQPEMSQ